jgi:hypothetical protein
MEWEKGGFCRDDWIFMRRLINQHQIKSVLEYGCGASTELLALMDLRVVSLESQKDYMREVPGADMILYQYPLFPALTERFDLAFVDGPGAYEFERAGKVPERKFSVIHAMIYADRILLHDGGQGQIQPLIDCGWHQDPPGYNDIGARNVLFVKS